MTSRKISSKGGRIKSESDAISGEIRIPTADDTSSSLTTKSATTGIIQAEKPKLVFAANGTLILQKPKLKVVSSTGSLQTIVDMKSKASLSASLNLETGRRAKVAADVANDEKRAGMLSGKERERPKLQRTLSGTSFTRSPGLKEVDSYMSKQTTTEKVDKSDKSEKVPATKVKGKSRSLKKQASLDQEIGSDTPGTPEKVNSPRVTGRVRSETPGPDPSQRSRRMEKGILKPTRSKSSESAYKEDKSSTTDRPTAQDQSGVGNHITTFSSKYGQREESPDTSHFDYLRQGRPKSRLDSGEKDEEPRSRDDSPADYESAARQLRRVHKELKGKEAKSFQELKYYNMTSKEERDEVDRIQEEIAKKLAEEKLMKELQNCSYLRRGPVEELSVEDVFAKD